MPDPLTQHAETLRRVTATSRAALVPGTPEKYPLAEVRGLSILTSEALLSELSGLRERNNTLERALNFTLDEAVDRWHESCPHEERPLHEWLGLTWEQCADFVQGGTAAYVAALAVVSGEREDT